MSKSFVLSAIGKDRPGIVAAVTRILYECHCNIEDSSMTILKGEFAMILIVSAPESLSLSELQERFHEVERSMGLFVFLKELEEIERVPQLSLGSPYMLSVLGADKPGIVYRVTQAMASCDINITDLNTKTLESGEVPVYVMMLEIEVPPEVSPEMLDAELKRLEEELSIDITCNPINSIKL
ncbi:MAG: amino acid-binding protein [Candidatus Tectomicrobia bacterium]|uniref:Amino acid-binding protein n=1 Tax=Tectimicrobiota bacterium TaxID=2528274 RepID=A0A932CLP7_UNCTE|nr:amino acid-binding protein [Candidatus Tectomicrobia bacterium]